MTTAAWTRDQLLAVNEDAATFYRRTLLGPDGEGPRQYLTSRGFEAVLDDTPWTIGHAPVAWTALHDHLAELGYSEECQQAAGLTATNRYGRPIDRFRDRITFGIRDQQDDLVGFTARNAPDREGPKYLNTPKTTVYDKSAVLFGLGEASRSKVRSAVVVEGPLDALAVWIADSDRYTPLASCGTTLTHQHADILRSLTKNPVLLAFDQDRAGTTALDRAMAIIRDPRSLTLGDATSGDPADYLANGRTSELRAALNNAQPALDVVIDLHLQRWPDRHANIEAALGCLREVARRISPAPPNDLATLTTRLMAETGLTSQTVTYEIHQALEHTLARADDRGPKLRDLALSQITGPVSRPRRVRTPGAGFEGLSPTRVDL